MDRGNIASYSMYINFETAALNLCGLPPFTTSTLFGFTWCISSSADLAILFLICIQKLFTGNQICLWQLPTCSNGKAFVTELAHLIQFTADGAAIEPIALNTLMVMSALFLQKPNANYELDAQLLCSCLQWHLNLWFKGEFTTVMISTALGDSLIFMKEKCINAAVRCLAPACECMWSSQFKSCYWFSF